MSALFAQMQRKLAHYRRVGAEPEAFIAGKSVLAQWDTEADRMAWRTVQRTEGRKHREFLGIPVLASRTASPHLLEIVVRHGSGPCTVEPIHL